MKMSDKLFREPFEAILVEKGFITCACGKKWKSVDEYFKHCEEIDKE
jgi:hypothetical protein